MGNHPIDGGDFLMTTSAELWVTQRSGKSELKWILVTYTSNKWIFRITAAQIRELTPHCSGFTNIVDEERRHFCKGWKLPTNETQDTDDCKIPEFRLYYNEIRVIFVINRWGELGNVLSKHSVTNDFSYFGNQ
ncbi:hypothetical protein Anas_01527 [Armadillidium nasatum]|uniref:Uncharacterized protein n=1 Tax=Armadillidium nasatum TaxID=96803 RepID=A0A5N5TNX7_9CRUS|nr:hypothetical protein Anas_01527 [Armadillidium nasatum]